MKTFIFLLLFAPLAAMSINDPTVESSIRSEISYPQIAIAQNIEGVVLVEFKIDLNGQIDIVTINSNDVTLREYITAKLKSMIFPGKTSEENYIMRFDFRLQ